MMKSSIVKRSIVIDGHKTSVSLEDAFWTVLKDVAHAECVTVSKVVADIDKRRKLGNLSSALRLFVLERTRAGGLPAPLRAFAGEGSQKSSTAAISSLAPDAI
jgi:predicted DNA-binding ribbon-helix-helix protein